MLSIRIIFVALVISFPLDAFAGSPDQPSWKPVTPRTHGTSAKLMVHGNLGDSSRGTLKTKGGRTYIESRPVGICAVLSSGGQRVGWLGKRKCIVPASNHFTSIALLTTEDYSTLDYSNKLIWQPQRPGKPFPKNTVVGPGSARVTPCLARVKHPNWYVKGKRLRPRSEIPGYIPTRSGKPRCWYVEVGTDKVKSTADFKILLHYKTVPKG